MTRSATFLSHFLLVVFAALIGMNAHAGETIWTSKQAASALQVGSRMNLEDLAYGEEFTAQPGEIAVERFATVSLYYTRDKQTDLIGSANSKNWSYRVSYQVHDRLSNTVSFGSLEIDFTNDLSSEAIYRDVMKHDLNSPEIYLEVTSIAAMYDGNVEPTPYANLPADIHLELNMHVNRHVQLSNTDDQVAPKMQFDASTSTLSWNYVKGASYYEVEWLFVDHLAGDDFTNGTALDLFAKREATRAETPFNHYGMDMAFPEGKLWFRVRGVGTFTDVTSINTADRKYSPWGYSLANGQGDAYVDIGANDAFENEKNWAYVNTLAEDGKHKSVVSYMDGALRNRQTVTNINSEETSLVAESIYDSEGRPLVNILPVPAEQPSNVGNALYYRHKFNRGTNNEELSGQYFENEFNQPLSPGSGAANYYSSAASNPFKNSPYGSRIPKADNYPYTQVEYTRDNTGRTIQASGLGDTYKMGTTHTSQTIYSTPSCTELYRMFGENVGTASHYKKIVNKDPNGQASVAYLDQAGRTIATCLTGPSPIMMEALEDNVESDVTFNYECNNVVDEKNYEVKSVNKIAVAFPMEVEFYYSMIGNVWEFTTALSPNWSWCTNCSYELEIFLTDPDGRKVPLNVTEGGTTNVFEHYTTKLENLSAPNCTTGVGTFGIGTFTIHPATSGGTNITLDQFGEYTLTKILRVDQDAIDAALQGAIDNAGLNADPTDPNGTVLASLIADKKSEFDPSWCYTNCEEHCEDQLREQNGDPYYNNNQAQLDADIAACCASYAGSVQTTNCDYLKGEMLKDIRPGGFLFEESLSGSFWTAFSNDWSNVQSNFDPHNSVAEVRSNPDDWDESWEPILLKYHREYCHYKRRCEDVDVLGFIYELTNEDSWNDAISNGLIDPLNFGDSPSVSGRTLSGVPVSIGTVSMEKSNGQNLNTDPLMDVIITQTEWDWIIDQLTDYDGTGENIWQLAYDASTDDAERWQAFVGMYLRVREKALNTGCTFYDDSEALFFAPPELPDQNEAASQIHDPFSAIPTQEQCFAICEVNAARWYQMILTDCGASNVGIQSNEAAIIEILEDYCQSNCDCENAYGLLSDTDISNIITDIYNATGFPVGSSCFDELSDEIDLYSTNCNTIITSTVTDVFKNQFAPFFANKLSVIAANTGSTLTYSLSGPNASSFVEGLVGSSNYVELIVDLTTSGAHEIRLCDNDTTVDPKQPTFFGTGTTGCCTIQFWDAFGQVDLDDIAALKGVAYEGVNPGFSAPTLSFSNGILNYEDANGTSKTAFIYSSCINVVMEVFSCCVPNYYSPTDNHGALGVQTHSKDCQDQWDARAEYWATKEFEKLVEAFSSEFTQAYLEHCMPTDNLYADLPNQQYQYTLYYYDQAGSLVQTVPPEGVELLPVPAESGYTDYFDAKGKFLANPLADGPHHRLNTKYRYNSLGQIAWQKTPDGGETYFWYNNKGQLVLSQNDEQRADIQTLFGAGGNYASEAYSYTIYDAQERISEVGEMWVPTVTQLLAMDPTVQDDIVNAAGFPASNELSTGNPLPWAWIKKTEVTKTHYEGDWQSPKAAILDAQENLRSRVSSSTFEQEDDGIDGTYQHATHYSYDPLGNVHTLFQEFPLLAVMQQDVKKVEYDYDLISGNVNEVRYQDGEADAYRHHYEYDADNRLVLAQTSQNGIFWQNEAKYDYFIHGPLARTEIGHDKVQGQDYVYTLQGWLKGVNSGFLQAENDLGQDGLGTGIAANNYIGRDAFGFTLSYHQDDYEAIGSNLPDFFTTPTGDLADQNKDLFNGNISRMATALMDESQTPLDVLAFQYKYDQLNRLHSSNSHTQSHSNLESNNNSWSGATTNGAWNVLLDYDRNGNIEHLTRNGQAGNLLMDNFNYQYNKVGGELQDNKLRLVNDNINYSTNYGTDLDDQETAVGQLYDLSNASTHNYVYDAIGNLIKDRSEEIENIEWTVYGKVAAVERSSGSGKSNLHFAYDAMGNRIAKRVEPSAGTAPQVDWEETYYVRDAQGNILATYGKQCEYLGNFMTDLPATGTIKVKVSTNNFTAGSVDIRVDGTSITGGGVNWAGSIGLTATAIATAINYYESERNDYVAYATGDEVTVTADTEGTGPNGFTLDGESTDGANWAVEGTTLGGGQSQGHNYRCTYKLLDHHLYGSSRIGVKDQQLAVVTETYIGEDNSGTAINFDISNIENQIQVRSYPNNESREAGSKHYELSNHLGNVLAVVSDRKIGVESLSSPGEFGHYSPNVLSFTDYYPFGSPMPGRTGNQSYYRFGFNGQEQDNEVAGNGNSYTAEYWQYDSRLGRRWNIDPVKKDYISNYSVLGNNPILMIDPNGADWFKNSEGKTTWHEATGSIGDEVSLKGLEGEWTNIGTEFLEFDGKSLTYSWQTLDDDGNPMVNSESFDALSGKGVDPTSFWLTTRIFDYSEERQATANVGPTPEGLYSISKLPYKENSFEYGFQFYDDLSISDQALSKVARGTWPGSTYSWGLVRWKLKFENAEKALKYDRNYFYLHGGSRWGSRGCIDCGDAINDFTELFLENWTGYDKVYLKVEYSENLIFEIQNVPTGSGLKFIE